MFVITITSNTIGMLVELAFSVGAEDAESWKVDALRKLAETAKV